MGTFIITPTEGITYNSYFIPNGAGCATQLTPVGDVANWECVDDTIAIPDDDGTYVYSNATNAQYDLYALPNHTTESGTINYVQVLSRGKATPLGQSIDGIYKILITDDACANIYKSDDIDLTTSYNTYNNVWLTNPRTDAEWSWGDIDNLQIGTECSSPSVIGALQSIFRPNGAGDAFSLGSGSLGASGAANNWECVDEESPDEDITYAYQGGALLGDRYDLYTIPNHTTEVGTIDSVSLFMRFRTISTPNEGKWAKAVIKIDGTQSFNGDSNAWATTNGWYLLLDYNTEAYIWNKNPDDSAAWEWTDIDNLQIGMWFHYNTQRPSGMHKGTQLYLLVDYHGLTSTEIRTTQCYARVNYTIPPTACTMDKPEEISVDHAQNVKMLNFWSGRRAVYGLSRNNRTMVMTGKLYADDACDTIEYVRTIAESGITISLSGLGYNDYDREVKIISFGWKKMHDKPLAYEWILELEFAQ